MAFDFFHYIKPAFPMKGLEGDSISLMESFLMCKNDLFLPVESIADIFLVKNKHYYSASLMDERLKISLVLEQSDENSLLLRFELSNVVDGMLLSSLRIDLVVVDDDCFMQWILKHVPADNNQMVSMSKSLHKSSEMLSIVLYEMYHLRAIGFVKKPKGLPKQAL